MIPSSGLIAQWSRRREELNRLGALVDGAKLISEMLADFERSELAAGSIPLTLREAADLSGYTADHLARLIRKGAIENAGRRRSPRIRVADLPRRPKQFDGSTKRSYDVSTDARTLRSR